MARLRNSVTGVVVNVDDATAGRLGPGWVPAGQPPVADKPQPEEKPAPRRRASKSDD